MTPVVPPDVARPLASFGVAMIAVMWTYRVVVLVTVCGRRNQGRAAKPAARARRRGPALTFIYLTVNLAYFFALTLDEMKGVTRIAERAATALVGPGGATFIAATVVVSTFGCNAAAMIAMSRACYAMAADGMFLTAAAACTPATTRRTSRS